MIVEENAMVGDDEGTLEAPNVALLMPERVVKKEPQPCTAEFEATCRRLDRRPLALADGGVAVLASEGIVAGCVEAMEVEAPDATRAREPKSRQLDEKSDNGGYVRTSAGVGDEVGAGAAAAPSALSNEEVARILASSNSGVKPDLSRHGYRSAKRAFDLVASGVTIVLLLVPGAILAAVICIKSPGATPLYSQLRVGRLRKDGSYKLFRMYKFRSMAPDADRLLDGLQDRNEADGSLFKIKDDPRIIPGVGQFICKHSIDESLRLINVFIGDIPLRILKTRLGLSARCMGAFALPAKSSTNGGKVFSQVVSCFASGLRPRRVPDCNSNRIGGIEAQFLAKPVFGAVCA